MNDFIFQQIGSVLLSLLIVMVVLAILAVLGFVLFMWWKWKDREERSLKLITLLVAVPQDNEVKIDATEQIINSITSLYKSAKIKIFQELIAQPCVSLEIIGNHDDIKFYNYPLTAEQIKQNYNGGAVNFN